MAKNNPLKLSPEIHFGKSAIISPAKKDVEPASNDKNSSKEWSPWGTDNNYPERIVNSNLADTTSASCLKFKIEAHYGQGPLYWKRGEKGELIPIDLKKEAVINSEYKDVSDFVDANDIENYLQSLASDFEWFNNCFSQMIFNKVGSKVVEIHHTDATFTRAAIIKDPLKGIEKYGVNALWKDGPKENDITDIPAINGKNYAEKFKTAMYHHTLYSPGRLYYSQPSWHSNGKYVELSSQIAIWIISNLENAINIKYHIQYPEEYFNSLVPEGSKLSDEERAAQIADLKKSTFDSIDDVLAGEEKAGKSLQTGVVHGPDGKVLMGWKIEPLNADTNHEAYLPASDVSAYHIGTSHGVPPSLSGLMTSKNTGAGSGSDIREAFNVYTQLRTQIARQTTLEALYLVKKINKWPDELHFGYRNIVLETMEENPTGSRTVAQDNGTN